MKRALIFGASGQAGHYLAKLLVQKKYEIIGTWSTTDISLRGVEPVRLDMVYPGYVDELVKITKPDEIYNLASKMFAPASWEKPQEYMSVNGLAVVELLNAVEKYCPECRVFQAGSAEVFDRKYEIQDERTPRKASSPYALSKIVAEEAVKMYRERGLWCCTGILFNMESPLRSDTFFAEKVAKVVVDARKEVDKGTKPKIKFNDLSARRDWGLTEEYVEAMWLMLQASVPHDYVIGTGLSHTCMDFLLYSLAEVALDASQVDLAIPYDPSKSDVMCANPQKINVELGWKASSGFHEVIRTLVDAGRSRG